MTQFRWVALKLARGRASLAHLPNSFLMERHIPHGVPGSLAIAAVTTFCTSAGIRYSYKSVESLTNLQLVRCNNEKTCSAVKFVCPNFSLGCLRTVRPKSPRPKNKTGYEVFCSR